jgi:hypothetical protein
MQSFYNLRTWWSEIPSSRNFFAAIFNFGSTESRPSEMNFFEKIAGFSQNRD